MCSLKFSVKKCKFAYDELKVLGLSLSRYGLRTIEERVKPIVELDPLKTVGELHRVVGMFNYYRSFIQNFSKIAAPLNGLKKRGDDSEDRYNSRRKIDWNPQCQAAFDELKSRLCAAPILAWCRSFVIVRGPHLCQDACKCHR